MHGRPELDRRQTVTTRSKLSYVRNQVQPRFPALGTDSDADRSGLRIRRSVVDFLFALCRFQRH